METERITLSQRERDRLKVLHELQQPAKRDRLKVPKPWQLIAG